MFFRMDTPDDWVGGRDHSYLEEGEELVDAEVHALDALLLRDVVFYDEEKEAHQRLRLSITSGFGFWFGFVTSRGAIMATGTSEGRESKGGMLIWPISSDMGAEASNESGGFGEKEQGPERSISEKGKLRNEARGTRLRCIVLLVFVTHSIGIRWGVYL